MRLAMRPRYRNAVRLGGRQLIRMRQEFAPKTERIQKSKSPSVPKFNTVSQQQDNVLPHATDALISA
jgi:hypothetical protein